MRFVVVVLLLATAYGAEAAGGDPGQFEIRSAAVQERSGVYYLNAQMALRLSTDAQQALRSGVPLTIRLDVQLLHHRRFWMDSEEAVLEQRYQLEYHALAQRYVVLSLNSGGQTSFATLHAALASLERVDELPVIDVALVPTGERSYLRLRVALDAERFPGPLRLLAFWRRDWSIESDWYRCSLPGP